MELTEDEIKALVSLRLSNAKQTIEDAEVIIQNKLWKAAANRLYYACYYAASALMVRFGFEAKTNSGIIRLLGLKFISKDLMSNESGELYSKLFNLRQREDFEDWVVVQEADIIPLIIPAKQFIATIEQLIKEKNNTVYPG